MKKSNTKDLVLVAWQDSDVTDIILDKSYGGKLAISNKGTKAKVKYLLNFFTKKIKWTLKLIL